MENNRSTGAVGEEREREIEMEALGFFGIIKLSAQIIFKHLKHFLCIALILSLPPALSLLLHGPSFTASSIQTLLDFMHSSKDGSTILPPPAPPRHGFDDESSTQPDPAYILIRSMAILIFSTAISLICQALLTFSACRACLNKSVEMRGSWNGARSSMGRLVVTVLCVFCTMVVVGVAAGVVGAVRGVVAAGVGGRVGGVIGGVGMVGLAGGVLYVIMILSLANTVAILEEGEWGWGAMKRSMHLLGGGSRTGMAIGLMLLFGACGMLLLPVFRSESWVVQASGVGINAVLGLFGMVAQVVLYMACRARLQEPLLALTSADPNASLHPKYLDLETAALSRTVATS